MWDSLFRWWFLSRLTYRFVGDEPLSGVTLKKRMPVDVSLILML